MIESNLSQIVDEIRAAQAQNLDPQAPTSLRVGDTIRGVDTIVKRAKICVDCAQDIVPNHPAETFCESFDSTE